MRMVKRITFVLAAVAPLAMSACSVSTSGAVGTGESYGYSTSAPTATDAQQSGSSVAPGHYGDTFVGSPEPGFDPDKVIEGP